MPKIDDTWDGGYIRLDAKGRKTFIIRRSVNGTRYEVSTRAGTWRGALEQLKRFEADPENYKPEGEAAPDALLMTEELVQQFLDWSRDEKKNSEQWRWTQAWALKWWATKLENLNLRGGVSLVEHIVPALDAEPKNRHHRIAVLKAFYGWLRKVRHEVEPKDDPTLSTLAVPQARPEQWTKTKVIPKKHYQAVLGALDAKSQAHWRAAMLVQAGTGWHVTETIRFARGGSIETPPKKRKGVGGVLVCPQTKGGNQLKTAVSEAVVEAAKELLAYGSFTYGAYTKALTEAAKTAGVPPFKPGRFRHTVATAAINAGDDPAKVSAFLNHKDPRTTRRFYAVHSVAAKVSTLA